MWRVPWMKRTCTAVRQCKSNRYVQSDRGPQPHVHRSLSYTAVCHCTLEFPTSQPRAMPRTRTPTRGASGHTAIPVHRPSAGPVGQPGSTATGKCRTVPNPALRRTHPGHPVSEVGPGVCELAHPPAGQHLVPCHLPVRPQLPVVLRVQVVGLVDVQAGSLGWRTSRCIDCVLTATLVCVNSCRWCSASR